MIIKDFSGFMDFGVGIDSVNGNVRGLATTRPDPVTVPGTGGQTVAFTVHKTEKIEDLQTALGLSVDAEASFEMFGGSEKFDFMQQAKFHDYSLFFAVSIDVMNQETHLIGEELIPTAAGLLAQGQNDRFRQEFGDFYMKGLQTGGQYFAVVEIVTLDTTDQTNISNELGGVGFFGSGVGDFQTNFNSTFQKVSSNRTLNINALQIGGAGDGAKQGVTPDEMLSKAAGFATDIKANPVPYRAEFQDFQALNVPLPPNQAQVQAAKDVIAQYASKRASLIQAQNDIDFIQQNPGQFTPPGGQLDNNTLNTLSQQIAVALNLITQSASRCMNDITACQFTAPVMPDLSKLPPRVSSNATMIQVPNDIIGQLFDVVAATSTFTSQLGLKLIKHDVPVLFNSGHVGKIMDANPQPGTNVPPGTTVDCGVGVAQLLRF
ncbi:MAG: hypothetical protein WBX22_09865 [Silvibacterium sp.]